MKLHDIGDAALVERVGRIVFDAFPPDEGDFRKWLDGWHADEQGAYHFGIYVCDVTETHQAFAALSEDQRADIVRFQQYLSLALDVNDLYQRAHATR